MSNKVKPKSYTERTDTSESEEYDWLDRDANENKDRGNGQKRL